MSGRWENIQPPALSPRVVFVKFANCFECSLQENCLGWIMLHFIWFKRHMFWHYVVYVCTVYTDVSKVHWQTIYCEESTVEKTGHFTLTVFGDDTSIM